jgi:allophanate hydrolase subunit 1
MQDIIDLERRITAALERIGRSVAQVAERAPEPGDAAAGFSASPSSELLPEDLQVALDEERMANAQLQERLRAVREREQGDRQRFDEALEAAKAAHLAEMDEMSAAMERLTTEITALQAERQAETEEITDIVAALTPLIEEARHA